MPLPTRPTSSRLVQLLREEQVRRPGPSPRRYITSGNAREGRVPKDRHGHQMPAIPVLSLTEIRTQMRYSNNNNNNNTMLTGQSSPTFLDKTGLVRSARAAPSLQLLWGPQLVPVLRMGWVVRTGYLLLGGTCLEARM
jgi:hypothetical protein